MCQAYICSPRASQTGNGRPKSRAGLAVGAHAPMGTVVPLAVETAVRFGSGTGLIFYSEKHLNRTTVFVLQPETG